MSFLRPAARAALWRWRDALAGVGTALVGLWIARSTNGAVPVLGWIVVLAGIAITIAGIQRGRFRTGAGGPGVVRVDEGQVAYFGPFDGGLVAIRQLWRLELAPTADGPAWLLTESGQRPLAIPTNAEGAEALFDVFATLDGIRTEHMLAMLNNPPAKRVLIWQSGKLRLAIPAH